MPARLSDIAREVVKLGCRVEEPSSGSHWKIRGPTGEMYPIPAHNGLRTEIGDTYVKKMCKALGLDFEVLRRRL